MIIDLILDRSDGEKFGKIYNAREFYYSVMQYGNIGNNITEAMDYGDEYWVKQALCNYIDHNNYNPLIKTYISQRTWLD